MIRLGLDIGSNSVGSAWIDTKEKNITVGLSVFPAGVEESEDKRGEPKNAKRRGTRRTRITLARRRKRKRLLRKKLIAVGLLPPDAEQFNKLLEETDPWILRRKGLIEPMNPYEFGRVLLHLVQRRGAMGFDAEIGDQGTVKGAISDTRMSILEKYASEEVRPTYQELRNRIDSLRKKKRTEQENVDLEMAQDKLSELCKSLLQNPEVTFGRFMADLRDERRTPITTRDRRKTKRGPREWRKPVRNRRSQFEFHADRNMIRDEFNKLWNAQKQLAGPLADLLTDELRHDLDDDSRDSVWRHRGLLFGQRNTYWDTGTLGRCVLEPTERCIPHADMYASRYLVVETVNNLKIIEDSKEARPLDPDERAKIKLYLSGPLGVIESGKQKGDPKRNVTVSDLRQLMGWGRASKTSQFRFNIESDVDRIINTDWFNREIVHGAITVEKWEQLCENVRDGLNRAILKHDPDHEEDAGKLKALVMKDWAGLTEEQADALVAAWKKRPRPDAKRLNMSRRAVRNLLELMDRPEAWPDPKKPGQKRWLTQIEARKLIAEDDEFKDVTTDKPLDEHARRRYSTGAKGSTARDRHYMRKHLLMKNGEPVFGPDGLPLHEPPPAPPISNPVVRKAIHEVRRHLIEYMITFGRKPDQVYVELSREAKMGKVDADRQLFMNRLRNRIRSEILKEYDLAGKTSTQQRAAVDRVLLCIQQGGCSAVCPLCGKHDGLTPRNAANGTDCEIAHIIPKADGGHNAYGNIVLAHSRCNRDMARRTPREFWESTLAGGFEEGMGWVERIYGDIQRIKPRECKSITGMELWKCYFAKPAKRGDVFTGEADRAKIERFKMDIKDILGMTEGQGAATKYAARQVMAYLADALYDGKGLPERGGDRLIHTTDGMWTRRLRREWGLRFDPHHSRAKGLAENEVRERKEKDRGDHGHHAIDAIVIALSSRDVQIAWDEREKQADKLGINTADQEAMENYRCLHRLLPPAGFNDREQFRAAVERAVFGDSHIERPVGHRPVKRKLVGALHKATLYGPVIDRWVQRGALHERQVVARVTVRQDILGETNNDYLKPAHLRMPRTEKKQEAIDRLTRRFQIGKHGLTVKEARKRARALVKSKAYTPAKVDPKPEKGGIVRDLALRRVLRRRLEERGLDPDSYTRSELKKSIDEYGPLTHDSGVPIHRVILLWSNSDPVAIARELNDYPTGQCKRVDDSASLRLCDSQNNHHIEIRAPINEQENQEWSGNIITAFRVAEKLVTRSRKLNALEKPYRHLRQKLSKDQRKKLSKDERAELGKRRQRQWKKALRELRPQRAKILRDHPLVDRTDNEQGRFVMSLCEGEMLLMKDKRTDQVGYFVVAKLERNSVVVVPHWDARSATGEKDDERKLIPDSKRDQFTVTPTDLKDLAPPDHKHARKVRVSPLGKIRFIDD